MIDLRCECTHVPSGVRCPNKATQEDGGCDYCRDLAWLLWCPHEQLLREKAGSAS